MTDRGATSASTHAHTGPLTRRGFLAAGVGALAAATLGDACFVEPTAIRLTRHELPIPRLASELDGLRIACLSDVHLHRGVSPAAQATLEALRRERPDVVVLIGDICNTKEDLDVLTTWAREAHGTRATFATLGNWEHDAGIDRVTAERTYARAGVELLYNSRGEVGVGAATITVVGIDDPVLGEPDPGRAVAGLDAEAASIWVLHAPGFVDDIPRHAFPEPAAILAGHTHGGQIRLPFYTPYTPVGSGRFVAGWYRDTVAPLYVSRGIGTVVVSARLFCPPEMPVFTLRATEMVRRPQPS